MAPSTGGGRPVVPDAAGERWAVVPVVLAVGLAVAGVVVTVWRPTAPTLAPVATDLADFDPAVVATIEAYRAPRVAVALAGSALQLVVPLAIALSPLGRRLLVRFAGERAHAPLRIGLLATATAVAMSLATLPLSAWSALVHEERWQLRVRTTTGWLRDWLVVSSGRWLVLGAGAAILAVAIRRWPRSWPYRATIGVTVVTGALVLLHPLVLQPLLLPTQLLADGPVRDAVEDVLAVAGHEGAPIVVGEASLRTTRANALVTGIGPTERVVLFDTLLQLPPDRLAGIVAHELAHQEHHDLLRGTLGAAALALPLLLVLRSVARRIAATSAETTEATEADADPDDRAPRRFVRGPTDPRLAAAAVAAVVVAELVTSPIVAATSRRLEAAADHRAIVWTQDADSLVRTVRAFVIRDLADPDPAAWRHVWWGTHPTPDRRIRDAVATATSIGVDVPTLAEVEADEADLRHPEVDAALQR